MTVHPVAVRDGLLAAGTRSFAVAELLLDLTLAAPPRGMLWLLPGSSRSPGYSMPQNLTPAKCRAALRELQTLMYTNSHLGYPWPCIKTRSAVVVLTFAVVNRAEW